MCDWRCPWWGPTARRRFSVFSSRRRSAEYQNRNLELFTTRPCAPEHKQIKQKKTIIYSYNGEHDRRRKYKTAFYLFNCTRPAGFCK